MPRQARKKSESGIYHIMLRGINKQQIFEDEEDRERFLNILAQYKQQCGYSIYAYCLMGNHIHILIKESAEELPVVFKRIAGSFVYWYNWKYHRCGHLFQDRFKSEPVEDDGYFLMVLRHIHQNPVRAELCEKVTDYAYSSIGDYLSGSDMVETDFALSMMPMDEFMRYHEEYSDDPCMELTTQNRLTDIEAKKIIAQITKCKTATDFQALEIEKRNKYLHKLHKHGLSIRQISRLTGLSKKIVEMNIR